MSILHCKYVIGKQPTYTKMIEAAVQHTTNAVMYNFSLYMTQTINIITICGQL